MSYNGLKNELAKILEKDKAITNTIQEMRMAVFSNAEHLELSTRKLSEKEQELSQLNFSMDQLKEELEVKSRIINELQLKMNQERERFLVLQNENDLLKEKISKQNTDNSTITKLSLENENYASKIRELIIHSDSLNVENNELKLKLELLHSQVSSNQEEELIRLSSELDELRHLHELEKEKTFVLNGQYKSSVLLLASQNNQIHSLSECIEAFINDKNVFVNDIADLCSENGLKELEIEDLKETIDKKEKEIDAIGSAINSLRREYELELEKLKLENNGLQSLNNEFKSIVDEQKEALSKAQTDSADAENEEFINKLVNQLNLLGDEKLVLQSEKEEAEKEICELQNSCAELRQTIELQKSSMKNLEDTNFQATLVHSIRNSALDKTTLKSKINELVREIDKCIALLSV